MAFDLEDKVQDAGRAPEPAAARPAIGAPPPRPAAPNGAAARQDLSAPLLSHWAEDDASPAPKAAGSTLPDGVRAGMEASLGADLSGVRVHTGSQADADAQAYDARAYTVGSDITFAHGEYDPASGEGRKLLAHELTHVVQAQKSGQAGAEIGKGIPELSEPEHPGEREADAISSAPHAAHIAATAGRATAGPMVMRAGRGERGHTAKPDGTDNPFKHMVPDPDDATKVIFRDTQSGKKVKKPKPPGFDEWWNSRR